MTASDPARHRASPTWRGVRRLSVLAATTTVAFAAVAGGTASADPVGAWTPTAAMATPRAGASAAALGDGRVLVSGGNTSYGSPDPTVASSELFDPATGTWSPAAGLPENRAGAAAVSLPDGGVLLSQGDNAGGFTDNALRYDPVSDSWMPSAPSGFSSGGAFGAPLPDGDALVAGGHDGNSYVDTVRIYDPQADSWSDAADLPVARGRAAAVALTDGRVLVTGGFAYDNQPQSDSEIYDPSTDSWTVTAPLPEAIGGVSGAALPGDKALITGGSTSDRAYVFDARADGGAGTWTAAPAMSDQRQDGVTVALPGGEVLAAGGLAFDPQDPEQSTVTTSAQIYTSPPVNSTAPVLSGTARVGATLSETDGAWTNDPDLNYSWSRCDTSGRNCSVIAGETGNTYVLTGADDGSRIRGSVTATNSGGSTRAGTYPSRTVIYYRPVSTTAPVLSGTARVGATLYETDGAWTNDPDLAYSWSRCDTSGRNCSVIAGETSNSYVLTSADDGSRIRGSVTATNSGGTKRAGTHPSRTVIYYRPVSTTAPALSGTARVGAMLGETNGAWTNDPDLTYSWSRCDTSGRNCESIPGETGNTYVLTSADGGTRIRGSVTATNSGGSKRAGTLPSRTVAAAGRGSRGR